MVTLKLKDGYRLKSETRQWILQREHVSEEGNIRWQSIGYYSLISTAVKQAYDLFLREGDADNIVDFMQHSRDTFDILAKSLSPEFELIEK